jgi:hypothetical protein
MSNKLMRGPAPLPNLRPKHIAKAQPKETSRDESHSPSFRAQREIPSGRADSPSQPRETATLQGISRFARNDGGGESRNDGDPNSEFRTQNSEFPTPTHSLAPESHARIDILLGASQSETISDILKLVRHAVRELPAGEHALVVNSICSQSIMDEAARKISRRQAAKMLTYTAYGQALREKLDFLETVIKEKHVRLLVISSFEFAATNARQRHALVHWLRQMRDEHALRIVVYSLAPEVPQQGAHSGPLALLAWLSDLVRHIRTIDEPRDFTEPANANETLKHLIEELSDESPLPSFRAQREIPSGQADTPSQPQTRLTQDSALSTQDYPSPRSLSLINKELEVEEVCV